jgi:hypothetical protein
MQNAVFWDKKIQFVPHRKHYISATEPSRLMLCKVSGFYGGDYVKYCLLGCGAEWVLLELTFRWNVSPPSSG